MILQCIEGLDSLVNLEQLWLGKNKITRLEVRSLSAYRLLETDGCIELGSFKATQTLVYPIEPDNQDRESRQAGES